MTGNRGDCFPKTQIPNRMRSNSQPPPQQPLLDNDAIAAWIFLTPALILLGIFLL